MKGKKYSIKFILVIGILVVMYLYHTSKFNRIYKVCEDPNKIAKIEIHTEQKGIDKVVVTDKESIEAFSKVISSVTFIKSQNNSYDKEYTLCVFPSEVEYFYSISVPNGILVKAYPGTEVMTPLYNMENYDALLSWINEMKDKSILKEGKDIKNAEKED
ncbi:hypothetical protein [Anaeropeptidivorans aminofermentans]|uniref:hypothetical protein n=1 Tax=Anaeropeptidivorans aminofermentans TaxID=2934315 RepID=UPI0020240561|nr:hypothetical protein [Anaeropeptidivorans aminofermentans]